MAFPSLRACQESPPLSSAVIAASPGTNVVIVTYIPGKTHRLVLDQSLAATVVSLSSSHVHVAAVKIKQLLVLPPPRPLTPRLRPADGGGRARLPIRVNLCAVNRGGSVRRCRSLSLEHPADLNYRRWMSCGRHPTSEEASVQSVQSAQSVKLCSSL